MTPKNWNMNLPMTICFFFLPNLYVFGSTCVIHVRVYFMHACIITKFFQRHQEIFVLILEQQRHTNALLFLFWSMLTSLSNS